MARRTQCLMRQTLCIVIESKPGCVQLARVCKLDHSPLLLTPWPTVAVNVTNEAVKHSVHI